MPMAELHKALKKIENYTDELLELVMQHEKIIILGNGGSSAVASHIAQDYTKMLGRNAITFSDASRLSCYANDYGWDKAYQKFLSHFADKQTLVILISSSGRSANILHCAIYCGMNKIPFITLTGFGIDNDLRVLPSGLMDFWVESYDYGVVEIAHLAFLHSILPHEYRSTGDAND